MLETIKNMPFKKKVEHIFEYYKLHIFLFVFGIFAIYSIINHFFINPPASEYLSFAFLGDYIPTEILDGIAEEIDTIFIPPETNAKTYVDAFYESNDPQLTMALSTKFFVLLSNGGLDFVIADDMMADELIKEDMTVDLSFYFSEEEISQLSDDVIFHKDNTDKPIGFRIKNSKVIEKFGYDVTDKILLIVPSNRDTTVIKSVILHLFK